MIFFSMLTALQARLEDEEGQGLAEYALILVFIAIVAVVALTFLGSSISSILSKVANGL